MKNPEGVSYHLSGFGLIKIAVSPLCLNMTNGYLSYGYKILFS